MWNSAESEFLLLVYNSIVDAQTEIKSDPFFIFMMALQYWQY